MSLSFTEISLDKSQKKLLIKMEKGYEAPYETIKSNKYKTLEYYNLINLHHEKYQISEKGRSYLRHSRKDSYRFFVPTIISILALIISIFSFLR